MFIAMTRFTVKTENAGAFERVTAALGADATQIEGFDSLNNPNAAFE